MKESETLWAHADCAAAFQQSGGGAYALSLNDLASLFLISFDFANLWYH